MPKNHFLKPHFGPLPNNLKKKKKNAVIDISSEIF